MEAAAPVQTCGHCGAIGSSRFCGECGQALTASAPPVPGGLRELVRATTAEVIGFDRRLLTTLRDLLLHPGRMVRDHLDGRTARYVHALKLFFFLAGLYVIGMSWTQPFDFSHQDLANVGISDEGAQGIRALMERRGLTPDELRDRFQDRMSAVTPLTTALSLLPIALLLVVLERGRSLRDHITFLVVISNSIWIVTLLILPIAVASEIAHSLVLLIGMNIYFGIGYFAAYRRESRLATAGRFAAFAIGDILISAIIGILLSGAIFLSVLYF